MYIYIHVMSMYIHRNGFESKQSNTGYVFLECKSMIWGVRPQCSNAGQSKVSYLAGAELSRRSLLLFIWDLLFQLGAYKFWYQ